MLLGSPKVRVHGVKGKMLSPLLVGGGGGLTLPPCHGSQALTSRAADGKPL